MLVDVQPSVPEWIYFSKLLLSVNLNWYSAIWPILFYYRVIVGPRLEHDGHIGHGDMELLTSSIHLCFCKFSSDDLILYAAENVVVYEQKNILVTASDIYAEVLGTKI